MAKKAPEMEEYKYGFRDEHQSIFQTGKGLTAEVVTEISRIKNEPEWMLEFRLKSLKQFEKMAMPNWGGNLDELDFNDIQYYVRPSEKQGKTWEEVPSEIKETFDKLGIPEAEQKFLAGVSAQYESEVVYHNMQKELEDQGVIFMDTDTALREHPEILREYFAT
ncbi:Fe-S cluster assembly protein SufB, partial [Paenibacillus barcinonensis]|nr:Fe-S cluster assembly protein SufB [Paenibacillus barcinonensis]